MILKNISGSAMELLKSWEVDEEFTLEAETRPHWGNNLAVLEAIDNEDLGVICSICDEQLSIHTAKKVLTQSFLASLAVDKNGTDQTLSGNDWTVVTSTRVLWDIETNYDEDTNDLIVHYDGIYSSDGQVKLTDIQNCTKIELAIFKRGSPDDYWFILDEKPIASGQTDSLLSFATFFDFYEGERYCIKIKLYGENASATIDGEDDYTAWGYTFSRSMHG